MHLLKGVKCIPALILVFDKLNSYQIENDLTIGRQASTFGFLRDVSGRLIIVCDFRS